MKLRSRAVPQLRVKVVDGEERQGDYEVGYGKPPKHTQFQKGQSGNPRGRKVGARGLKKDLSDALDIKHTIKINGKLIKGRAQKLGLVALAVKAASGDLRAMKLLAELTMQIFGPGDRGGNQNRLSEFDQKLLGEALAVLEGGDDDVDLLPSDMTARANEKSSSDAEPESGDD